MSLRGMQLSMLPYVEPYWLENPGAASVHLPQNNVVQLGRGKPRRHSPKGKASGWIKERLGNTQRKKPTTNYYYCWDEPVKRDGQTKYQRHQVYVPVKAIAQVQEMISQRQPVAVVLGAIEGAKGKK
jgi:hypothetical protein